LAFSMCTIISKNYLALARTLVQSFLALHPEGRAFVLLVDRNNGHITSARESFELVEVGEIGIPEPDAFFFRYDIMELNTAVKPFFLDYLLRVKELEKILYFDPDILVLQPLDELYRLLDEASILLTPHCLSPIPDDGKRPSEIDMLKAGAYNLGFIGLAAGAATDRFLEWWKDRLTKYCFNQVDRGLFVDQKWIDLVPGMFEGTHIIREPRYNAAYWNLHERPVTLQDGVFYAADQPIAFYHFSGFGMETGVISRHQNRINWGDMPDLRPLFDRYKEMVLANGDREAKGWTYSFGYFDNGAVIPGLARRIYHSLGKEAAVFGNPFQTGGGSFFAWVMAPARKKTAVPLLVYELYRIMPQLQARYPDPFGRDERRLLRWARGYLAERYGFSPGWIRKRRRKGRRSGRRKRGGSRSGHNGAARSGNPAAGKGGRAHEGSHFRKQANRGKTDKSKIR